MISEKDYSDSENMNDPGRIFQYEQDTNGYITKIKPSSKLTYQVKVFDTTSTFTINYRE